MSKNIFKIKTKAISVELSGERDFLVRTYESMRGVIMDEYEKALIGPRQQRTARPSPVPNKATRKATPVNTHKPLISSSRSTEPKSYLIVSGNIYNNTYILKHHDFVQSPLANSLAIEHINHIYVSWDQKHLLNDLFAFETPLLWRKLKVSDAKGRNRDKH